MNAALPANEAERIAALRRYRILDTSPEAVYDDLARLAAYICQTPISLITFIDGERQWFKAHPGIEIDELNRNMAFCAHTILSPGDLLVVPDTHLDPRFSGNPLVTGPPYVRFYAGIALMSPDGFPLGTLCVLDTRPRRLKPEQQEALQALGRQTVTQLEMRSLSEMRAQKLALEAANRKLQALATTDGLTGLKNHRAFQETLRQEFAQARRSHLPLALVLLDIDHFKEYNDTFGHPAGDEVLKVIAQVLKRTLRAGDVAARHGGEEFAVILPDTDALCALHLAERLRRAIAQAPGPLRPITASFGIAAAAPTTRDHNEVIAEADAALYRSKAQGRNQVSVFPEG